MTIGTTNIVVVAVVTLIIEDDENIDRRATTVTTIRTMIQAVPEENDEKSVVPPVLYHVDDPLMTVLLDIDDMLTMIMKMHQVIEDEEDVPLRHLEEIQDDEDEEDEGDVHVDEVGVDLRPILLQDLLLLSQQMYHHVLELSVMTMMLAIRMRMLL